VCLNDVDRSGFIAQFKQIKAGAQATDPKDFVTLDQVVAEEQKDLYWAEVGVPEEKTSRYIFEDDRVVMVSNPKAPVGGNFFVGSFPSTTLISEDKQVVNLGTMREKCRLKNNDLNLEYTYRVLELPDPTDNYEAVHKKYCDDNSGKTTGGGNLFSTIFGAIAGGVAGALTSFATQGIATGFGSIASAGASAFGSFLSSGLFQGGMRVGS